ncbi:MAG: hypothetical protein ACP5U1_03700 [Desulfomonilaceae bacterium]
MSRRLICVVSICCILMIYSESELFAQWPLGKDLAPVTAKSGEVSGYLTGSGRFQVFVSPNIKGHTFMLDTESGRIWMFKKDNASGDISLEKIPVDKLDESPSGVSHRRN